MFLSIVHDAESDFKIFGPQNYGPHFTHTSALTVRKFGLCSTHPQVRILHMPLKLPTFNQSINHLFAHNTSGSETTLASRRDEQYNTSGCLYKAHKISKDRFIET